MTLKPPQFCSGQPAAWCRWRDAAVDLSSVVGVLIAQQQALVWLDSARLHQVTGRFSILGWEPWLTLEASAGTVSVSTSAATTTTRGNPLGILRRTLQRYPGPRHEALPPVGLGFLGALGYELNRWIERLPAPKPAIVRTPELLLFGMQMVLVVDHATARTACLSFVDPHMPTSRAVADARDRLEALEVLLSPPAPSEVVRGRPSAIDAGPAEPLMSQAQFEAMVMNAQDFIAAGEIFQANLAHPFIASWAESPWPLYQALRGVNPSPFACFLQCPQFAIVSCSPERLVRVHHGQAEARPIAGTRPRGRLPEEDLVNSLELILSDKERAEHIMLVDLARNDLGRACRFGSVVVDDLMALEDYSHVIHLVSNIQGTLHRGVDVVEVIQAMFPGGTITGCPKVRAMEIIHELEPVSRGLYTGSCGYLGFDGSLDLNILIRTIVISQQTLAFHVGAGIVADSQPDREYHETLAKAGALLHAVQTCRPVADRATQTAQMEPQADALR